MCSHTPATVGPKRTSLRNILKHTAIMKDIFNVRHDPDALFAHFGVAETLLTVSTQSLQRRSRCSSFPLGKISA